MGRATNRIGVGVRIKVVVNKRHRSREIHRVVGCGTSFGGSPHRQEIGLGDADRIESLEVYWPVSRSRQVFRDVQMDQMIRVTEGDSNYKRVPLKRVVLNGGGH